MKQSAARTPGWSGLLWHAVSTPPACNADIALRGKPCSSNLDTKYLLYAPIFTGLNSLIGHNAYISSLMNPLQINESFRLIPSYGCRASQLLGQRRERETTSLRLHWRGHPPPYGALAHQTSDMTSGYNPATLLQKRYSGRQRHGPITVSGTKEQVSVKKLSIAGKSWIRLRKTPCWHWSFTWKEHFPNLKRNFFSV